MSTDTTFKNVANDVSDAPVLRLIDGVWRKPIVLIDMDGVIANWQEMFDKLLTSNFPHIEPIPFDQITSFKTQKFYPVEHQQDISNMMNTPGYYRDLAPYAGAVAALHELSTRYEVFLCTAPYVSHTTCASEKMEWVKEHLGGDWAERMVITSDKTLARGDFLVDDKPKISGVLTPVWTHIVFDAPYNRDHALRINEWAEGVAFIDSQIEAKFPEQKTA